MKVFILESGKGRVEGMVALHSLLTFVFMICLSDESAGLCVSPLATVGSVVEQRKPRALFDEAGVLLGNTT